MLAEVGTELEVEAKVREESVTAARAPSCLAEGRNIVERRLKEEERQRKMLYV